METNRAENPQGATQHVSLTKSNKGKEPALPDHSDPLADDELSSDISPFPHRSSPQNNVEAESRKIPHCRSSRAISGTRHWMRREANRDRPHSELAPEHISTRFGGMAPQFLPTQYPCRVAPAQHAASYPPVRGPQDILSFPLGQHILDYEPPRGFVIPPFAMYAGSSGPYDHMLHFNQAMILNAGNN